MLFLDKQHDARKNDRIISRLSEHNLDLKKAIQETNHLFDCQYVLPDQYSAEHLRKGRFSFKNMFTPASRFFFAKRFETDIDTSETYVDEQGQAYPTWKNLLDEECRNLMDKADNEVNVRDFGAAGDGVTDDTEAFLKAIGKGHVKVQIPEGIYITKGIRLPSWTCLIGAGKGKTVLKLHDSAPKSTCLITNSSHWKGNRNIHIEGMSLDWNVERLGNAAKTSFGNNFSSCLLFAKVTFGWVKNIEGINPGLHCFDVSSTLYNYSGDGFRARGGSNYIWLDGLNGYGFGDDGITTHHSDNILISNSHMCDPSGRSHKKGFSNSNGIEVDDGSRNVWLINNSSARCFGGIEVKAHHNSSAAANVHIIGHLSVNDNRSYNFRHIGHHKSTDPESKTAFNIRATNIIAMAPIRSSLYEGSPARALVISAYRNVAINYFTLIGDPDYDYLGDPVIAIQYRCRNVTLNNVAIKDFKSAGTDIKIFGGDQRADSVVLGNLSIRNSAQQAIHIGKGIQNIRVNNVFALGENGKYGIRADTSFATFSSVQTEGYKVPISIADADQQTV